jgi:hypothetical protein
VRKVLTGLAGFVLAASTAAVAFGQSVASDAAATAKYRAVSKACSTAGDVAVWLVPGSKLFFRKGAAKFGKGVGTYVCRHVALSKHARDAAAPTPAAESPAPAEATAAPAATSTPESAASSAPLEPAGTSAPASAAPTMAP